MTARNHARLGTVVRADIIQRIEELNRTRHRNRMIPIRVQSAKQRSPSRPWNLTCRRCSFLPRRGVCSAPVALLPNSVRHIACRVAVRPPRDQTLKTMAVNFGNEFVTPKSVFLHGLRFRPDGCASEHYSVGCLRSGILGTVGFT